MSPEQILPDLAAIVHEVTGIPVAAVQPGKSFTDDLDIDSLSMVEIATAAEDRFSVRIPDDVLSDLVTVGDAVTYIERASVPA